MNVFIVVVNAVLVALTAAVVLFAWRTIGEAKRTTSALGDLLAAAKDAGAAARETVVIAEAARAQAEFDERLRALLDVGELVERIFSRAREVAGFESRGWRVAEQNLLQQALARVGAELPEAKRVADGTGIAETVMAAARDARLEVEVEIGRLLQHRP